MRAEFPTDPPWAEDEDLDEDDEGMALKLVPSEKRLAVLNTTAEDIAPYRELASAMSQSDNWWRDM